MSLTTHANSEEANQKKIPKCQSQSVAERIQSEAFDSPRIKHPRAIQTPRNATSHTEKYDVGTGNTNVTGKEAAGLQAANAIRRRERGCRRLRERMPGGNLGAARRPNPALSRSLFRSN